MPKVTFLGNLRNIYGEEIETKSEGDIFSILDEIDRTGHFFDKGQKKVRPGFIVLVNGIDMRLLRDGNIVKSDDKIEVIPINHGG